MGLGTRSGNRTGLLIITPGNLIMEITLPHPNILSDLHSFMCTRLIKCLLIGD